MSERTLSKFKILYNEVRETNLPGIYYCVAGDKDYLCDSELNMGIPLDKIRENILKKYKAHIKVFERRAPADPTIVGQEVIIHTGKKIKSSSTYHLNLVLDIVVDELAAYARG